MNINLSENIRLFRKQRKLTQEQLGEVLGVSTGAVYKWESGLSVPELDIIVEMADFFDVSVDVLLGYKLRDNRIDSVVERIIELLKAANPEAISEAEKALKKYPYTFEIVLLCAEVNLVFGAMSHSKSQLLRAIELLEQSLMLISQNRNPDISEFSIYGTIGEAYLLMGESEKGLELMKKHNTGGAFNATIGASLAFYLGRHDESEPYIAESFVHGMNDIINAVHGYASIYRARGEFAKQKEILLWGRGLLLGLSQTDETSIISKINAYNLIHLADAEINNGEREKAREYLKQAFEYVRQFDNAPDFTVKYAHFVVVPKNYNLFDSFGTTAMESAETFMSYLHNDELESMWKEVKENDQN